MKCPPTQWPLLFFVGHERKMSLCAGARCPLLFATSAATEARPLSSAQSGSFRRLPVTAPPHSSHSIHIHSFPRRTASAASQHLVPGRGFSAQFASAVPERAGTSTGATSLSISPASLHTAQKDQRTSYFSRRTISISTFLQHRSLAVLGGIAGSPISLRRRVEPRGEGGARGHTDGQETAGSTVRWPEAQCDQQGSHI